MPESPMDVGDDFENLAKSYELNNKPDSAYKYHRLALATYDSLYRNRIKGLTGFQQLSFEQQQQLQQLEAQKTAAQNTYRIYGLLVGLGIIGLIGFFLYRNNQQQRKANQRLQKQKQETEEQKHKAESALQELKSAQAQLIQSEKMASLGELTAGIAHEIQNPLNFVNNFSEVSTELVDELKGERSKVNGERDEELETAILNDLSQNLVKINHHGKRADAIVKGMLEHSRTTKGEKQVTDLNALADEYLRLSYHGLRAKDKDFNATIETDFDETIGKIEVVAQDIGRVLLNLYNNAFHAVNERRKSAGEGFKPIVQIQTKKVNSKVEVVVKDNGDGIPENVINKIFQPFFTTKPTGQGTGLGLSLSYDIIKAHGGEIKVQSKEGEGSTFIIQL
jgi:signal transduction histidine kinase